MKTLFFFLSTKEDDAVIKINLFCAHVYTYTTYIMQVYTYVERGGERRKRLQRVFVDVVLL